MKERDGDKKYIQGTRSVNNMVVAELVDGCNLRCELCVNRFRYGTIAQMSLSTVDKILKRYPHRSIDWFNWGEPVLHKEFCAISDRLHRTASRVSTNLSHDFTDVEFHALLNFRVVLVSLSGMTENIYKIYHHGGNFALVMSNLDRLARSKKKFVIVNWLSHKYNTHQLEICRDHCKQWGWKFNPTGLICTIEEAIDGFDHELMQVPRFQRTGCPRCRILDWDTIGVDGSYLLCCNSQNIKIGYTIDDDVTHEDLVKAKMAIPICNACQRTETWRLHS